MYLTSILYVVGGTEPHGGQPEMFMIIPGNIKYVFPYGRALNASATSIQPTETKRNKANPSEYA
jgi:hypothetical protein